MKENGLRFLALAGLSVLLCSCASSRKILYLQDLKNNKTIEALHDYEPTIKRDDKLYIVVSAPNREVAAPYNQGPGDGTGNTPGLPYQVDAEGYVDFPILGRIMAEGKTRRELSQTLTEWIATDVKDPTVNVAFANYRVTILGEVRAPGTYTMPSDRTTIFQALGMAGDMTIAAKRSDVLLLREVGDGYQYVRLDLRSSDILSSPYYHLNQNDLLYVAPNTSRISAGTAPTTIFSIMLSSASFLLTLAMFLL